MSKFSKRPLSYMSALAAGTVMSLSTGCASGGFKLTRQYAGFVNRQMIILRIILYIFTYIVFAVTMLIDLVIFNTMDFWEGRVSAGDYQFKDVEKVYQARHEILPGSDLKRSTIKVFNHEDKLLQEVVLQEAETGEIEVLIDGQLRSRVRGISEVPIASIYGKLGEWIEDRVIVTSSTIAQSDSRIF